MSNVGYATLTVLPSAKGFASALSGEINTPMASAGKDGGAKAGGAFAGAFKSLVAPALAFASVGAIGGFVKGAIADAGDLEQSAGAIETVFKGSSLQMLQWSASAASSVGLTKNEFNELGTLIGSQLKNGGTAMDQLGPKTQSMISLGADLASMYGGTSREAIEALSSALKGERDPIEKYGVSLTQAAIDAKAASLGFSKVGGTLSQEATQAATLALIMDQTTDAHGNFAKEADTMQGQQQRLAAGWGNIKSSIGAVFLPALTSAMGFINTSVMPGLSAFADGLAEGGLAGAFKPILDVAGPVFQMLAQSFGPLIPQVLSLASAFSPVHLIFMALQPVLPALIGALGQLAGTISGVLGVALTYLSPLIQTLVTMLGGVFIAAMPGVTQMVTMLGDTFTQLTPVIMGVFNAVMPLVFSLLNALFPILTDLVSSVMPTVVSTFGDVLNAIGPLIQIISAVLVPVIQALLPVVVMVFQSAADIVRGVMRAIQGVIQIVTGIISGDWGKVWTGIQNLVGGVWDAITALISGAIRAVMSILGSVLGAIGSIWNGAWNGIVGFLGGVWNNIVSGVSGGIGQVIGFFGGLIGQITGALGNAGSALWGIGQNIIQGLINGIGSMMGAIGNAILSLVPGPIVGVFKDLLGIHSPSRVFRGFGVNIGEGLVLGIQDMHHDVERAMGALAGIPAGTSFATPDIQAGGIQGALVTAASKATGAAQAPIHQENHFNVPMSEEAYAELAARKLLRAGVGR